MPPWGPGAARGNGHRQGKALATVAATRRERGHSTPLACKAATTGPPRTTYTVGDTFNSRQRHPLHPVQNSAFSGTHVDLFEEKSFQLYILINIKLALKLCGFDPVREAQYVLHLLHLVKTTEF